MNLEGKVALVTGASRGVGAATAVALAEAGTRVACAARATDDDPVPLPGTIDDTVRLVETAGGEALAVPTNLADDGDVDQMVERTVERFGALDVLVNNAAITFPGDLDAPIGRYDLMMQVDLRAPFLAMRAARPHLGGGGAVLNVSSAAALGYFPGLMTYGMAKVALEHLSRSTAAQLQGEGVAVNCLRIDLPVASEGFVANTPDLDHSGWHPSEVPARLIRWMLEQDAAYTGRVESMADLMGRVQRAQEGRSS